MQAALGGVDDGSLIYTAAYHGNVRHLKKLLARMGPGAEARRRLAESLKWRHPHGGATAIYVAAEFGHIDAVRLLLEAGDLALDRVPLLVGSRGDPGVDANTHLLHPLEFLVGY